LFEWVDESNIIYYLTNFDFSKLVKSRADLELISDGISNEDFAKIGFALYPYLSIVPISTDSYILCCSLGSIWIAYSIAPDRHNHKVLIRYYQDEDLLFLLEAEVENSLAFGFIARIYYDKTPIEKIVEKALLNSLSDIELEFLKLARRNLLFLYADERSSGSPR